MQFKPAQKNALKAAILADPALAAMATNLDYQGLAAALNADASPVTKAWRNIVQPQEIDEATNWTAFDALPAGKRDSWRMFFGYARDFGRNKVRSWVTDIWGNATAGSNAEAILLAAQENASRAEVIIGGTTKTTNAVSGLDRSWYGEVQIFEIGEILA